MANDDVIWFTQRAKRQARIRIPAPGEFEQAWEALGFHWPNRRRVLVWRIPKDNPGHRLIPDGLMRIPFLAFADETIEDSDSVLLPILDTIMKDAAAQQEKTGGMLVETGKPLLVH